MGKRSQWFPGSVLLLSFALCADVSALAAADGADEDAKQYVQFVEDFAGTCTARNAKQILVKSTHPSRKIRVWLDRYHMGTGTGDRSKTDLLPGAEPDPLGCARTYDGPQEWRLVRAAFVE